MRATFPASLMACVLLLVGGLRAPPKPPCARRTPAQPGRSSGTGVVIGARGAPQAPLRSSRPGAAGALLGPTRGSRGSGRPPPTRPPALVAPRRSRGAPRAQAWLSGHRAPPQTSSLGSPGGLLDVLGCRV